MIPPMNIDGVDYYAVVASPIAVRHLTKADAAERARERHLGRDWRRIKREMRKAWERA